MNRRAFLGGLLGVSIGAGTVVGSGAFSSINADRQVSVEIADDDDAYLFIDHEGSGSRSDASGSPNQVQFSFPGFNEDDGELGLGLNSVYEFDADAEEIGSEPPLFQIGNQGTQAVDMYTRHETDTELEIEIYRIEDREALTETNAYRLAPQDEPIAAGMRIKTFDAEVSEFSETIQIIAEA